MITVEDQLILDLTEELINRKEDHIKNPYGKTVVKKALEHLAHRYRIKDYLNVCYSTISDNEPRPIPLEENDYVLVNGAGWFTVGKFSIRIYKTDEGVVADIYPLGQEHEAIAGTYAFDDEIEEEN